MLSWIAEQAENFRDDGAKLIDKLLRVSRTDRGPQLFDNRDCHHICDATVSKKGGGHRSVKIWQLSGKKVRLHWFYDDGRKLIIAHAFLKKDNRIPATEQARAVAACQNYFAALARDQITIVDC